MSASQPACLGYPNGFDAGDFYLGPPWFSMGETAARRPGPAPDARSGAHRIDRHHDEMNGTLRAASSAAARPCQGWPRLCGHSQVLALIGPSTAACLVLHAY